MSTEHIDFITYCISGLSDRLSISQKVVYKKLKQSGILTDYILKGYDVLHTFSKEYLLDDIEDYMREKGVLK